MERTPKFSHRCVDCLCSRGIGITVSLLCIHVKTLLVHCYENTEADMQLQAVTGVFIVSVCVFPGGFGRLGATGGRVE